MANECPECQTNNPDTVKFCGGIADRIIVKLLKLRAWKVVNWLSAMLYENKAVENKALEIKEWISRFITSDPMFDEVRKDPRFQALLKKMRLN